MENLKENQFFKIKMKSPLLLIAIILCTFYSFSQINEIATSSNVFYISIIKSADYVFVFPMNIVKNSKKSNFSENTFFITHKDSVENIMNKKSDEIRFIIFKPDCYVSLYASDIIYEKILPIVPDSIKTKLRQKYTHDHFHIDYSGSNTIEYKNYTTTEITESTFLVILMPISLLNEYTLKIRPRIHRFKDEKYVEGLYVKVLIPI